MARKSTKKATKLYAAVCSTFGKKFAFHAMNDEDAQSQISSWNRYHSFYGSNAHTVVEVKEEDLAGYCISVHDEYMR